MRAMNGEDALRVVNFPGSKNSGVALKWKDFGTE